MSATVRNPEAADDRWNAVVRRDRTKDGTFVYAVATTGVFCKPSCGSRRPLRRNVRFFGSTADAVAGGFRACKRCRPLEIDDTTRLSGKIRELIERAPNGITLHELARRTGTTATRVHRAFKRTTGLSPKEFQDARRNAALRNRLRAGDSVTRAGIEAGYASTSRVHRASRMLGMSPRAFREGGKGMQINYGAARTALGEVLVAYTERGVCSVTIGDDREALERELHEQFSAAELRRTGAGDPRVSEVASAIAAGEESRIPLDLAGTEFQLRVWQALRQIPAGETRSYQQLARSVGKPSATRAVASACARNRVAVLVPCHRVIRGDGALGGYRWGVARKQRLLDRESSASKP
jgi:AraC family transcriptional regulator of adaptative response/methylated-DNA-[protein]-cysteine methyltransferase